MKRMLFAVLLGALSFTLTTFLQPGPVGRGLHEWLAVGSLPRSPQMVAAVETTKPPTPLDAALILRAVQRFDPKGVKFLDPLAGHEGQPLLDAKLAEMKIPADFAVTSRGNTPGGHSLADGWVQRMTFDRLMVRTERAEHGEISLDLDMLFRGRIIIVEMAGGSGASEVAAAQNHFHETVAPPWVPGIAVVLAASLPWWRMGRIHRAMTALAITCAWLLAAMVTYPQSQLALPLVGMLALPILALIPPRSNKVQQRELPT